jgi:anti-sigma B factor antagonist
MSWVVQMPVSISRRPGAPSELPAPFSYVVEDDGSQVVLTVVGEIDVATVPRLDAALTEACDTGRTRIELDLSGTTFMDSAGLHLLLTWTRAGAETGIHVTVARCSQPVWRLLELTGTTQMVGG